MWQMFEADGSLMLYWYALGDGSPTEGKVLYIKVARIGLTGCVKKSVGVTGCVTTPLQ